MFHTHFNFLQSTGAFIAVSRYASATPVPPSVLSRGIGWQVNKICEFKVFSPKSIYFSLCDVLMNLNIVMIIFTPFRFSACSRFLSSCHFSYCLWSPLAPISYLSGCRNSVLWNVWDREWIICFCVRFLFKISLSGILYRNHFKNFIGFSTERMQDF